MHTRTRLLGAEGVPAIITKMALMEFFHCDWLTLHDIPFTDWQEALLVLGVQADIRDQSAQDATAGTSGVQAGGTRSPVTQQATGVVPGGTRHRPS